MAKKQKSDLRSHSSHSLSDIEYLHINLLYFHDEEGGVLFQQCPTGV